MIHDLVNTLYFDSFSTGRFLTFRKRAVFITIDPPLKSIPKYKKSLKETSISFMVI